MKTLLAWLLLASMAFGGETVIFNLNDPTVPGRVQNVRKTNDNDYRDSRVIRFSSPVIEHGTPLHEIVKLRGNETELDVVTSYPVKTLAVGDAPQRFWKVVDELPGNQGDGVYDVITTWSQAEIDLEMDVQQENAEQALTQTFLGSWNIEDFRLVFDVLSRVNPNNYTATQIQEAINLAANDRDSDYRYGEIVIQPEDSKKGRGNTGIPINKPDLAAMPPAPEMDGE